MEVPVINRLSNFDCGVACLQNPSFLSQILSLSAREKVFQGHAFWKWSAFIIAVIASFGTLINRIRTVVIRLQCRDCDSSGVSEPLLAGSYDDFSDYSDDSDDDDDEPDDDDDDDDLSFVSDLDDDEPATSWPFGDDGGFHVKGSGYYGDHGEVQSRNVGLRWRRSSGDGRRFSWSDFSSSRSVVKLWDSWGLGFDLDSDDITGRSISENDAGEFRLPVIATSSQATILSAETVASGRVKLGVWDARAGSRSPAMLAEWGPIAGGTGVASDGAGKVYVRDDVTGGLTIGDLRNFRFPLKSLAAYGVDESDWTRS